MTGAVPGGDLPPYSTGRRFSAERRVRLADVDPSGEVRFDAIARYLQDVATDDVRDARVEDAVAWVVRRTTIVADRRPRYGETLRLVTWCSGIGTALAERRTSISGDAGAAVETVALWVSLDRRGLRPVTLDGAHFDPYRPSAAGRRIRGRFVLPAGPGPEVGGRPWPLRDSDFDLYRHVNNVVSWAAAEEEARRVAPGRRWAWGQVEYRRPIEPGAVPTVAGVAEGDQVSVWLLGADGTPAAAGRLSAGADGR